MFTITPLRLARIDGSTARVTRMTPQKLVSNVALNSASGANSMVPKVPMPALFTSASMCPSRARIVSTAVATDASSVTSRGRVRRFGSASSAA